MVGAQPVALDNEDDRCESLAYHHGRVCSGVALGSVDSQRSARAEGDALKQAVGVLFIYVLIWDPRVVGGGSSGVGAVRKQE